MGVSKRDRVMQIVTCLGQLGLLWGIYFACNTLVTMTGLPIPANVLGIVVLFSCLCLGVIKMEQVGRVADFLLRHLVFFFIPVAVGLMEWGDVFYKFGLILLAAIVISSIAPFLVVGFLTLRLQRKP